jgi:hypothetical protein
MAKEVKYTCSNCGSEDGYMGIGGYSCNICDPEGDFEEEY